MLDNIKSNENKVSIRIIEKPGQTGTVMIDGKRAEQGKTYTIGEVDAASLVKRGRAEYVGG